MTDEAFARAFEAGTVTVEEFDHVAHMRVGWVYLREEGSADAALPRMRHAIQAFAIAAGRPQRYHETITVVWLRLLDTARRRAGVPCELSDLLRQSPELANKDLPLKYYSNDRLFSDDAREAYVPPDLEGETIPKSQFPTPK